MDTYSYLTKDVAYKIFDGFKSAGAKNVDDTSFKEHLSVQNLI